MLGFSDDKSSHMKVQPLPGEEFVQVIHLDCSCDVDFQMLQP